MRKRVLELREHGQEGWHIATTGRFSVVIFDSRELNGIAWVSGLAHPFNDKRRTKK